MEGAGMTAAFITLDAGEALLAQLSLEECVRDTRALAERVGAPHRDALQPWLASACALHERLRSRTMIGRKV